MQFQSKFSISSTVWQKHRDTIENWLRFQISRDGLSGTVEPGSNSEPGVANSILKRKNRIAGWQTYVETFLVFVIFALFAGQLPPDVNESHYLTKAKYFWNSQWCQGDIFLSSSFSHWLFYFSLGWMTRWMTLESYAWVGRIVTWLFIAFGWRKLCYTIFQKQWISILAAAFFLLLNDRFHLAGEWVVGGFEAKGLAYGFVLLAMTKILVQHWSLAWIYLGLASAFHVLVGGWATLAALFTWFLVNNAQVEKDRPRGWSTWANHFRDSIAKQFVWLVMGGTIALIGVLPPLLADQSADRATNELTQQIYVNHRIAHHLTFSAFPTIHVARFGLLVLAWAFLLRGIQKRSIPGGQFIRIFYLFTFGTLLISFAGLVLSGLAEQKSSDYALFCNNLLRFYWFRLSDFAVPACLSITGCWLIGNWWEGDARASQRIAGGLVAFVLMLAFAALVQQRHADPRPRADQRSLPSYLDSGRTMATFRNWKKVCFWIKENTPSDAAFITPDSQQTFKWYAQRKEVVCWKDIPQDPAGILEWKHRLNQLYEPQRRYDAGLMSYDDQQLKAIGRAFGADYLLIPQRHLELATTATDLQQVYPEDVHSRSTYVVLKLD